MMRIKFNKWMFIGVLTSVVLLMQIQFHWSAITLSSFALIYFSKRLRSHPKLTQPKAILTR